MDAQGYAQCVDDAINKTAAMAGMDPAHWRAIAQIESGVNPQSNRNADTQFKGMFQLGRSVWHDYGSGDIYNPMDNAIAAAKFAQANGAIFRGAFGRDPTPIETYIMHQQGPGFYTKGQMSNIAGNPYSPKMNASLETPQSFEEGWRRNMEDKVARMGGQAGTPFQSVAGTRGYTPSGSGAVPAGVTASSGQPGSTQQAGQPGSTQQASDGTQQQQQGSDLVAQIKNLQDRYAQQDQAASAGPQLQPLQFMTPQMFRMQQLVRAMQARQGPGVQPLAPLGSGTGSGTGTGTDQT